MPVATARGKIDVSIKGKLAVFDIAMLNQLYFAQTQTQGYNLIVDNEQHTIAANVATASNIPLLENWGAQYTNGLELTLVTSTPAVGQYTVNLTSGVYTFNTGDNTNVIALSYTYATNLTSQATVVINNQLMGFAPELTMLLYNKFRNKYFAIELNDVTLGEISIPSKLEDFWIADFTGSANADLNNVLGKLFMDTV